MIRRDVNPRRNRRIGLNHDSVVRNISQKMSRESRRVGDERVLHLLDEVGEEERRLEVRRPRLPAPLDACPRHRRFYFHTPHAVLIDHHLIHLPELPLHLHDLHPLVGAGEHVVDDGDAAHHPLDGFEQDEAVAEEEGVGDGELDGVLGDNAGVVHVGVDDPRLRQAGEAEIDSDSAETGGLVVAVHAGDEVCLAGDEDAGLCRENDDIRHNVVVAGEDDGGAGEGPLVGIASGGDALAEVGVADVGLVAALDGDAGGVKVGDVAVVDARSEGFRHLNSAASEV